jgi:lipopolysaccharide biosynthesis glycosyltransferase
MIKVFIGTEANQFIPQKVLEYSIRKNTKHEVEIQGVRQNMERVGGTNFGFVRFLIPKMCNFEGKAIYCDADQLVLEDIDGLYNLLDPEKEIALVKKPEGTFGGKTVANHNQTSVMVLNCEKLKNWNPDTMFKPVIPNRAPLENGKIHYRDFMKLDWMNQEHIQEIDPRWNHFNIVNNDTKLVHFSHVRSQPWKKPSHPLAKYWGKWLKEAIENKFISKKELFWECMRGHVHKSFLKFLF